MAGLLGGKKSNAPTVASGLQLQSSVFGNPITVVYGTTRISPNLIWYGDFTATPVSQGSKGGKGTIVGGGGKAGNGEYQYQVSVAMALCEGPIYGVADVYVDKAVTDLPALGFSLFNGTYPQAPWSYLYSQESSVTESHSIPSSAPYSVTLNSKYGSDAGVVYAGIGSFTAVSANPGYAQYVLYPYYNGTGVELLYTFSASNAGTNISISYYSQISGVVTTNETIPSTSPYQIILNSDSGFQTDNGVIGISYAFTEVGSSPAANQYVPGNSYLFNAANKGQPVQITYYPVLPGSPALGYNGIAYVANSSYQLGQSAALPNHNFEVEGIFARTVAQEIIGEQDTISSAAYTNGQGIPVGAWQVQVEYYQYFISDSGVTDLNGTALTPVPFGRGIGTYEYTVSGGVYTFSTLNANLTVQINYTASIGPDADPSLVVADFLTNAHYGAAFPSAYVGNLSTYQAYCIANGLLISLALTQQVQSSQILEDIATNTNSAWVWSNGQLTLIPYGDQTIMANGYTYTAPSAPVVALNDSNFMKNENATSASMNNDPVILSRKRPADQINSIKLNCLDRANNYNQSVVEAKDQTLIETFRLRQSAASNTNMFCNLAAAKQSAQLQLQRQYIRNVYSFQLPQTFIYLDPMDIVSITDSTMGISNQWVRILEITENDDGSLSFSAEEYLQGTGSAAIYNYQTSQGYASNYNIDPGNVNAPIIFEPNDALAGQLSVWIAASGINTDLWGGCDVYISTDGNSYAIAGRIEGAAKQGFLSATLAAVTLAATGQTIDQTNTLAVNVSESGAQIISGSQQDATNLNTLCYVDGEYIAYQNSSLVGSGEYDLTYLIRGAYGSTVSQHVPGSNFTRLNSSIFEYNYASALIGTTVLFKFLSFNIWGGGEQSLSEVQPYTYIVQGTAYSSPLPNVTGFATAYVAGLTQLIWDAVSDFRNPGYEIRQGTTWNSGNFLYRTNLTQGPISGDGIYWIAAYFIIPNSKNVVYSATPVEISISGSQITQNIIASYDQAALNWPGTLTNTYVVDNQLQLAGGGINVLGITNYLSTPNILLITSIISTGTYEIPVSERVFIGRVAPCQVIITLGQETGYSINAVNILGITNYLSAGNILGVDLGNNTSAKPQIRLSQDGVTFGPWQNWIPGSYSAQGFDAQVVLDTLDPSVQAVLSDFIFTVDVPTLTQTGTNISIPLGGEAISFGSVFNGGVNGSSSPNIQVTILGAVSGDTAIITAGSLSGFTIVIQNGGISVARNINWISQGF